MSNFGGAGLGHCDIGHSVEPANSALDALLLDVITIIGHIGCYIACDIERENSSDSCYQVQDGEDWWA